MPAASCVEAAICAWMGPGGPRRPDCAAVAALPRPRPPLRTDRLPAVPWRTRSFTAESNTSSSEGSGKDSQTLPWDGAGCLRFRGRVRGMTLRCEAGNDLYVGAWMSSEQWE